MTYRSLLKSKIHRAVVTSADVDYEGSLTVDRITSKKTNDQ